MQTLQTSATRSATSPSIANSYRRVTGGTPTTTVSSIQGPKIKPLKDSVLEKFEAEQSAREAMLPREMKYQEKKAMGMRDIAEMLDPGKKYKRTEYEQAVGAASEYAKKQAESAQQWLRNQDPFQGRGPTKPKFDPELMGRYEAERQRQEAENARRQAEAYRQAMSQYRR